MILIIYMYYIIHIYDHIVIFIYEYIDACLDVRAYRWLYLFMVGCIAGYVHGGYNAHTAIYTHKWIHI